MQVYEQRTRSQGGGWGPWTSYAEPAEVIRDILSVHARKCVSLKIKEFNSPEYRYVQWRRKENGQPSGHGKVEGF